ncbi:hypothetical protein [Hyphococcus sp.]|uniref:hypothetical protein n=1 Tax=Hyphococcus sp. TaxID=2038636 RepID=UPI003D0FBAD1
MSELSRKSLSLPDAVAAGFLLAGVVACANDGGDAHVEMRAPARGLVYAREACASCHAVEVGEFNSPNAAAPSFAALAGRPDMTRSTLSALLRSPHRNMPNLIVEPDRVDDLAAYLSALGNGG